jgi:hypothetical protein
MLTSFSIVIISVIATFSGCFYGATLTVRKYPDKQELAGGFVLLCFILGGIVIYYSY